MTSIFFHSYVVVGIHNQSHELIHLLFAFKHYICFCHFTNHIRRRFPFVAICPYLQTPRNSLLFYYLSFSLLIQQFHINRLFCKTTFLIHLKCGSVFCINLQFNSIHVFSIFITFRNSNILCPTPKPLYFSSTAIVSIKIISRVTCAGVSLCLKAISRTPTIFYFRSLQQKSIVFYYLLKSFFGY